MSEIPARRLVHSRPAQARRTAGDDLALLRRLTQTLLDEASSLGCLTSAVDELYELFAQVTGLDRDDVLADGADSTLASGRALSPRDAALCLRDSLRTAKLLRGVQAAIREQQRRHPGRPVEIVYAGTGPFAPLGVPLMALHTPDALRFTLIDVHERSTEMARRLVEHFGLTDAVRAVETADATAYVHPPRTPPGLAIAEAMQRSLSVEPQAALTRQLARQLGADGIMIPRRVSVELAFGEHSLMTWGPAARDGQDTWRRLAAPVTTVMDLTKDSAGMALDEAGRTAPTLVTWPHLAPGRLPMLVTTIDVFAGHTLEPYESGLTCPEVLWQLAGIRAGERVAVQYQTGPRPGLVWERLDGAVTPPQRSHPC